MEKNHDERPIEIFPKQTRLRAADNTGGWIHLPYYGALGDEPTTTYAVVQSGEHLTLEQFLDLAEKSKIDGRTIATLQAKGTNPFVDGPPCLQTLHNLGYPSGMRNQGLYNVGTHEKIAHPDDWKDRLSKYNDEKMDPPLPYSELQGLISSLERRDYTYKCKELPIQPHCKIAECRKQKYGIGYFAKAKTDALFPVLTDLAKVETDPPRWQVRVNNIVIEATTEDLLAIQRFRKLALERAMVLIPAVKQPDWDEKIRELMTEVRVVKAPEDAGVLGQFKHITRDFLSMRKHAESRDDVAAGRPFEENGKIYFRSIDLIKHLTKHNFREYSAAQLFTVMQDAMKAEEGQLVVKKHAIRVWVVPVEGETPALETAKVKGKSF
jgi:hypothetical protein